jgi:hypothetical protein
VLNFRSTGGMRLGHVAVVSAVVGPREIEIDHANWGGGLVSRYIPVVDVSPNNDWTAVRVGMGRSEEYGNVYPTFGFIYPRADDGGFAAPIRSGPPAPIPALNPTPKEMRAGAARGGAGYGLASAVAFTADAPTGTQPRHGIDLSLELGSWTDKTHYDSHW